jgi:hypothetical protein
LGFRVYILLADRLAIQVKFVCGDSKLFGGIGFYSVTIVVLNEVVVDMNIPAPAVQKF